MSINIVALSGNLGRDAELRVTKGGQSVTSFSVAVNSRKKDPNGEWVDYPNWVGCILYGRLGEVLAPKLTKGTPVSVSGSLSYSSWESEGTKRSKLEVVVKDIEIMSKGSAQTGNDLYDEDIPF